ncbi:MAG: DUF1643 domain-containing protein [Candidatus Thiodiazotropha sp. (ex Troendleina suluensis)]|nr:DUF1643 domain-containing protein [Candidatus Thiodiazotropha sp. (ex Troendleina suluensis)]
MFLGLNQRTTDETNDAPNIRRCIGFAIGRDSVCCVSQICLVLRAT